MNLLTYLHLILTYLHLPIYQIALFISRGVLFSINKGDCCSGYTFLPAFKSEFLGGRGFDRHGVRTYSHHLGELSAHRVNEGS